MITRYINRIHVINDINFEGTSIRRFSIFGDGCGDFEEHFDSATNECLKNYIEYCKEQIKLAEELLNE